MITSRIPLGGALLMLLVVAVACSSTPAPSGSASGSAAASVAVSDSTSAAPSESAAASAEGSMTSAFDLEVGDCFNTDDISTVDEVAVVGCEAAHVYEVFGLGEYGAEDDAFPGDDALTTAANEVCRPAFEDYVGVDYDSSEWHGTFINPSEETWAQGDREILCVLHTGDETEVTGSAEGSAR